MPTQQMAENQMMMRSTGVCDPGIFNKIKLDRTTFIIGKFEQERKPTKTKDPRSFSPSNIGTWKFLWEGETGRRLLPGRKETKMF